MSPQLALAADNTAPETVLQGLQRLQTQISDDAGAALMGIKSRLDALSEEAAALNRLTIFSLQVRQSLAQTSAMAHACSEAIGQAKTGGPVKAVCS